MIRDWDSSWVNIPWLFAPLFFILDAVDKILLKTKELSLSLWCFIKVCTPIYNQWYDDDCYCFYYHCNHPAAADEEEEDDDADDEEDYDDYDSDDYDDDHALLNGDGIS